MNNTLKILTCIWFVAIVTLTGAVCYELGAIQERKTLAEQYAATPSTELAEASFDESSRDKRSPSDWIKEENIHVYADKIVIDIENPKWARFSDTKSMDPLLDATANGIEIVPQKESDINVGDVVSYHSNVVDTTVIHRVVSIGEDEKGWYAVFKGDNNNFSDPEKVRFGDIKRVLVAVIY
jgi:hypothetical protein